MLPHRYSFSIELIRKSANSIFTCLDSWIYLSEFFYSRIRGRILQLETVSQSESTRRRLRFLSHFSLTTTFQVLKLPVLWDACLVCYCHCWFSFWLKNTQFCEIDLSEALPSDALHPFMDEIKKREKQRKQVARKVLYKLTQFNSLVVYSIEVSVCGRTLLRTRLHGFFIPGTKR